MRPLRSSAPAFGLLALVALGLAGCAPNVADRDYGGFPPGVTPEPVEPGDDGAADLDGPAAYVIGDVLALTTWGSSSCHRVADSVDWESEPVRIVLGRAGGPACTADMAAHTLEFDLPERLRGGPIELELAYTDWDGVDRLTAE